MRGRWFKIRHVLAAGLSCVVWLAASQAQCAVPNAEVESVSTGSIISKAGRMTINLHDVDIADLLRMLSVREKVNIVTGKEVSGPVSVNLYEVTFEEALRSILEVNGYSYTVKDDIVLVTGATQKGELPIELDDSRIQVFKLDYFDPSEAYDLVKEMTSKAGNIHLSRSESVLVVEDSPAYVQRIGSLIRQLDVVPKQVLIEAQILRVALDDSMTLGVDFRAAEDSIWTVLTEGFATSEVPGIDSSSFKGLYVGYASEHADAFLEALEEKTDVQTLAKPKILAVHGKEAEIIIGERLGFRITTTTQTSSLESVEFLEVGTHLTLTPYISDDRYVMMDIHPEVSEGNVPAETGLPEEITSEATTTMIVKDGHTIVLGGLIREMDQESRSQVPFLGDVPVLGHLFRRTQTVKQRVEIIVLITPHIVDPMTAKVMQDDVDDVIKRTSRTTTEPAKSYPLSKRIKKSSASSLPLRRSKAEGRIVLKERKISLIDKKSAN